MDAALRAYHCRKAVNNPFVAGHCYFEAQALSNSLTNGLGDKKGAELMRSLYSAFYGSPAETLWSLRTWLGESERGKLRVNTQPTLANREVISKRRPSGQAL
jgi:hypothetical protein